MVKGEAVKALDKATKRKANKSPGLDSDGPPAPKLLDVDLYAKVVINEEKESKLRDANEDASLYLQTCENIRKTLIEIAQLKCQQSDKNLTEITEKQIDVNCKIILLKKLNRIEKMRMKKCRDELQSYREQVDSDHLHLQNLMYENLHLSKEVTKCYNFKSVDEDMDLIPVEDFYKMAPKSISKEEITKNNSHELKLARLSWELTQRKELAAKIKQLEVSKEAILKDIESKKEQLCNLTPHLKTILDATKPLQTILNIPIDKNKKMHELALMLPRPMYILYVQACAYSDLITWLKVSITGKPEDVKPDEQHYDNISSADSDSDGEVGPQRRRKLTQDRRKSGGKSSSDAEEALLEECFKSHPLCLQLTISLSCGTSVSLEFRWLLQLQIVCVKATVSQNETSGITTADLLTSSSLLSAMFPGDLGENCPNPAAVYHLKRIGLSSLLTESRGLGVPYQWAQTLCGLNFVGDDPSPKTSLCQQNLESTIRIIRERLRNRISLAGEIKLLESGEALTGKKLQATLSSFTAEALSDYEQIESGLNLVERGVVDGSYLIYKGGIDVCGVKMVTHVALPPNYPSSIPIFILEVFQGNKITSINNDHLRDLEREVNTRSDVDDKKLILVEKMHKLLLCTEVLTATEFQPHSPVSASYFRAVMGRKRSHPYHYLPVAGGIFTHE